MYHQLSSYWRLCTPHLDVASLFNGVWHLYLQHQDEEYKPPAQPAPAPSPQLCDCSFSVLKIETSVTSRRANARLTSVSLSCAENDKPGQGLPQPGEATVFLHPAPFLRQPL